MSEDDGTGPVRANGDLMVQLIGDEVLLELLSEDGGRMTFALPIAGARNLARILAELPAATDVNK